MTIVANPVLVTLSTTLPLCCFAFYPFLPGVCEFTVTETRAFLCFGFSRNCRYYYCFIKQNGRKASSIVALLWLCSCQFYNDVVHFF